MPGSVTGQFTVPFEGLAQLYLCLMVFKEQRKTLSLGKGDPGENVEKDSSSPKLNTGQDVAV